jgi:hypothetical protein
MSIYQKEIDEYIAIAKKDENAVCVLVVCDMFDWSDYLVTIYKHENLEAGLRKCDNRNEMSKIMEKHML